MIHLDMFITVLPFVVLALGATATVCHKLGILRAQAIWDETDDWTCHAERVKAVEAETERQLCEERAQNAAIQAIAEWTAEEEVDGVIFRDLADVLSFQIDMDNMYNEEFDAWVQSIEENPIYTT